ncbi:CLM7 protein, partial [Vidua chalybeata]|nr:CLM7 protein [Vidua chalybeata]
LQGQTPQVQRRREGGTLYMLCPYAAWTTKQQTKYWCLLRHGDCQEVLRTYYEDSVQSRDRRIEIKDNTASKAVSVTMTDLKAEDSDTYFCSAYNRVTGAYTQLRAISLNVFRAHILGVLQGLSSTQPRSQATSLCSGNTFLILSVVLLLLLLLALLTSAALGVRYYRLLLRTGNREAEDTSDRPEGTARAGSTGRREGSQDDSKGPAYINLDVQSHPSPEDPLYCNVKLSQAPRNPQEMEYAVIAFNQPPRTSRE